MIVIIKYHESGIEQIDNRSEVKGGVRTRTKWRQKK